VGDTGWRMRSTVSLSTAVTAGWQGTLECKHAHDSNLLSIANCQTTVFDMYPSSFAQTMSIKLEQTPCFLLLATQKYQAGRVAKEPSSIHDLALLLRQCNTIRNLSLPSHTLKASTPRPLSEQPHRQHTQRWWRPLIYRPPRSLESNRALGRDTLPTLQLGQGGSTMKAKSSFPTLWKTSFVHGLTQPHHPARPPLNRHTHTTTTAPPPVEIPESYSPLSRLNSSYTEAIVNKDQVVERCILHAGGTCIIGR
jgi:hypothetical protein